MPVFRNIRFKVKGVPHRNHVRCDDEQQIVGILANQFKVTPADIEIVEQGRAVRPPLSRLRDERRARRVSEQRPANTTSPNSSPVGGKAHSEIPDDPVPLSVLQLAADVEKKLLENGFDCVQKIVSHLTQHRTLVGLKGIGKTTDEAIKASLEALSDRVKAQQASQAPA